MTLQWLWGRLARGQSQFLPLLTQQRKRAIQEYKGMSDSNDAQVATMAIFLESPHLKPGASQ